jgi:CRISPR-associated protein Cmr2
MPTSSPPDPSSEGSMKNNYFARKLFALLHDPHLKALYRDKSKKGPWDQIPSLVDHKEELEAWWDDGVISDHIAAASDRLTFRDLYKDAQQLPGRTEVEVRHPISGQPLTIRIWRQDLTETQLARLEYQSIWYERLRTMDPEQSFWWFWRFFPEEVANEVGGNAHNILLLPADTRIPDCPIHVHNCTVSSVTGAMFAKDWQEGDPHHRPYLLLFTFSPVQEFIKSSRKFLDFWAGSYLLHYLSARLCWFVAQEYGPDAVITPSLWGQEIIDALLLKKYPDFERFFKDILARNPVDEFEEKLSSSLSTAGFPNLITVLVSGESEAKDLGQKLTEQLNAIWQEIGVQVRDQIRRDVMKNLEISSEREKIWKKIFDDLKLAPETEEIYRREFDKWWKNQANWEWNKLWDAQLKHTWESYWVTLPLGDPERDLTIKRSAPLYDRWKKAQQTLSQNRDPLPTKAEEGVYLNLNVGTWWGSLQARLGQGIQAIKNTRTWRIPVAPGERSTISGLYSAVHPNFVYSGSFQEGGGLPAGSQRLFWRLMAEVYPNLFNGSEHLNAIELTKRMAWKHGGVAESLGISVPDDDYENLIRFPNLSSIASARFAYDHPDQVKHYWTTLNESIKKELPEHRDKFESLTRRPFHISKVNQVLPDYNGIMFSSKWLADDLGLNQKQTETLRKLVDDAHRDRESGFRDGSPSDWWCLVLADGDDMGKYVNGKKLKPYAEYLPDDVRRILAEKLRIKEAALKKLDPSYQPLLETKKRMGPSTHIGLNRALLDFSNRLVPYLTEHRFCGKVIYSGGDDVMAALPLEDLPEFLLSLSSAWCGGEDPMQAFKAEGGYWIPTKPLEGLPNRPLFTMGEEATMSLGIVIAHKSVPLPTVLENIWEAEKERAKKLPGKDGLCFRVIYGSGNTLEAVMKGSILKCWWKWVQKGPELDLGPVLYRLAEELPLRCAVTEGDRLFALAATTILARRERSKEWDEIVPDLIDWLNCWENWILDQWKNWKKNTNAEDKSLKNWLKQKELGTQPEELGRLLRFSAFWIDKKHQRDQWRKGE